VGWTWRAYIFLFDVVCFRGTSKVEGKSEEEKRARLWWW